tara:strand:+ start:841 stop:1458 length:618 start_codon:yes stop_codon:yes gene_type:complete
MKRYLFEFIGTFFLVMTIGLTGNPLAIGIMLAVLVYMGGHISGAHYNPAVTISIYLKKLISKEVAIKYILVQIAASTFASAVIYFLTQDLLKVAPSETATIPQIIISEFLFTFLLVLVILNVATNKKTEGNSYYGLAIGFTVMASAYCVGGISGGAFNPAVGLGPEITSFLITKDINLFNSLIYLIVPTFGGIIAYIVDKDSQED